MSVNKRNVLILGVTGNIACGKSEVGRVLGELDFAVYDADHIAHDLMQRGTPVFQRVVEHFGKSILTTTGEISRPALGRIVFEESSQLQTLNQLVHPAIRDELSSLISKNRREKINTAVLIPLLFESGMEVLNWDFIWCVSSSEQLMLERLEKRGFSREEAESRMDSQMSLKDKESKSDLTISNTESLQDLEQQTRDAVDRLFAKGRL